MVVTPKSTFRDRLAANPQITEAELINSGNKSSAPPTETDVTVVGGGIHGLIYSITTKLTHADEKDVKVALFEKASRPQWKIGESTLPYFGTWLDTIGLKPAYMLRLFTLHDGLEFYILDRENQPEYKDFCARGPRKSFHTPHDEIPSMTELAEMFGCRFQYIWSIGYAIRNDTPYPDAAELATYGSNEAERRFNFITKKYTKLTNVMNLFTRIEDHYGSDFAKWHIRKQLNYQSTVVSGPGWVTVGDGIGFTNPLLSPGINAGMGSDTLAAELTLASLRAKDETERREIWSKYDKYADGAVKSLHMMNQFLYATSLHPDIGAQVGFPLNMIAGHAKMKWGLARAAFITNIKEYYNYATHWVWGAQEPIYVRVAEKTLSLLGSDVHNFLERPTDEVVKEITEFAATQRREAVGRGEYIGFPFRYYGWFRYFNNELEYDEVKYNTMDSIESQCHNCKTWYPRRNDFKICGACGVKRLESEYVIGWNEPLIPEYMIKYGKTTPTWDALNADHVAWLTERKIRMEAEEAAKMTEVTDGMAATAM
ncbi:hypothetical protein DL93DRAFT_2099349 [Clavulina sp. PMI_390]|nr:hypothetical protein DL93DRAFT_2099349 [Clavulina sp. PMI_390]